MQPSCLAFCAHRTNRKSRTKIPRIMLWLWFGALPLGDDLPSFVLSNDDRRVALVDVAPLLIVQTSCEAMVPAYCRGRYGFQVNRNGKWLAGPDPSGFSVSGRLSKRESRRLRRAVDHVLGSPARQPSDCDRRQAIPGVGETVTVQGRERAVKLQGAGGQLNPSCAPGHPSAAELFALADALVRRYYPRPFRRQ